MDKINTLTCDKSKLSDTDPRKTWKPMFKLVKIYPGFEKKGLLVSEQGYTANGVIPVVDNPRGWPEFWDRL